MKKYILLITTAILTITTTVIAQDSTSAAQRTSPTTTTTTVFAQNTASVQQPHPTTTTTTTVFAQNTTSVQQSDPTTMTTTTVFAQNTAFVQQPHPTTTTTTTTVFAQNTASVQQPHPTTTTTTTVFAQNTTSVQQSDPTTMTSTVIAQDDSRPTTSPEKWELANKYYNDEDYSSAITLYEEIVSTKEHSSKLFYNLGNAYFRNNNIGRSILNYNRALMLDPNNKELKHNLKIAKTHTVDIIDPVPQFFLVRWIKSFGSVLSSNGWAVYSLIFLVISLAGTLLWLIHPAMKLRKTGFYTALISAGIFVITLSYAQYNYARQKSSTDAIIIVPLISVKNAPATSSRDIFVLHEGTKVTITDAVEEWCEILIEDGNKGWINPLALERIAP